MPLPMIIVRQAWRLLRTAHVTLQEWRRLPPERQAELRGSMQRVGPLVVELSTALRERKARSDRPLKDMVAELGAVLGDVRTAAPELSPGLARTRRGRLA